MNATTVIRSSTIEVAGRLDELNLKESDLLGVVRGGLAGWNDCTENHPATAPGFYFWSEATAVAREIYRQKGWIKHSINGVEMTLNKKTGLAVAVLGGDERTGHPDKNPSTRNRKGAEVRRMTAGHPVAETLPGLDIPIVIRPAMRAPGVQTWVLLCSVGEHEVRSELSWPARMGEESAVISVWIERIMLEVLPLGGSPEPTRKIDSPAGTGSGNIEIAVTRKAG